MDSIEKLNSFPFQLYLKQLYEQFLKVRDGEVASYIPELAKAKPDSFGISLVTTDGHLKAIGDTDCEFTLQSISKPFVYGLALEDLGTSEILKKINTEPSGDAFNSISLEPLTGRPLNPMINAGAIATTSCVQGHDFKERLARIQSALSLYAGRNLSIDNSVYKSEKKTGHRNRAIAYMLRNFDIVEDKIETSLDLYFEQCSILANCVDLATMAATLANDGINPITGVLAVKREYVPLILSVMSLCGMYDYSGRWIYDVGLPAKSGVGGGIIAVLPGQFGFAVYSPRLDVRGNSVRGIQVCKQFSEDFGLHLFGASRIASSAIRCNYTLKEMRSKRIRTYHDSAILDKMGAQARIFELQGELRFAAAEAVIRQMYASAFEQKFIVIDFRRVPYIDLGAYKLLGVFFIQLRKNTHCKVLISSLLAALAPTFITHFKKKKLDYFHDLDHALEWVENQIIKPKGQNTKKSLEENELCQSMSKQQLCLLKEHTKTLIFKVGEKIIQLGEVADKVYFLMRGEVSINLHGNTKQVERRIATFSAGMCFGELALLEQTTRTADVVADTEVECLVLNVATLAALYEVDMTLKTLLLENLAKKLSKSIRQSNLEVIALSGG